MLPRPAALRPLSRHPRATKPALASRGRAVACALALAAGLALCLPAAAVAAEVQAVTWADLVPPAPPRPLKPALRSFLAGRPAGLSPDHTSVPEGRWLSPGAQPRPTEGPPQVVAALDGKRVKIGGYVVPLDFDATRVKEFLLVPFVGACIHVPPPPANQIVYVKSEQGFEVKGLFDPVWVTGRMATEIAFTGLAEAGYSLTAEAIEARPE